MPTPVPAARQCLTDEAARALDDAVAVARRRTHAQTTSLHVVSAFLSSPSSLLSSACSRAARSMAANFSPRLQFRALDLSVGVSLDRLPTSKHNNHDNTNGGGDDAFWPPISNSLMAAIKRSQANQRRQPEIYHHHHLSSIQGNPVSITSIKVELKQFVLSILDDPVVSRVFGEAGFRSCDIKLAIIHPPSSPSFNLRARCPPVFLCNLSESGARCHGMLPFPFDANRDEYCKRIGEVMIRKSGRNPVLVGVGAVDALSRFRESVEKGRNSELPSEIHGLRFISVENDIKELVRNGGGGEEAVEAKAKELEMMLERSGVAGVVVSIGGLEALVEEGVARDALNRLVLKLSGLMRVRREKMWLIGSVAVFETYSRFLERFPLIEQDWDLQPLPITSSKSSLMGSFVPFAGFFSGPSDFKSPLPVMNQCFTRCGECNEKCAREISAVRQGGSSASMVDKCSTSLPTWLQMADSNSNRTENVAPETTKDDKAASKSTVLAIERKWDDICKRHQRIPTAYGPGISLPRPETHAVGFPFAATRLGSERGDVSLNERVSSGMSSCLPFMAETTSSQRNDRTPSASLAENAESSSKLAMGASTSLPHDRDNSSSPTSRLYVTTLPFDHISCSSNSVTTDLGLGMVSAYKNPEPKAVGFENHGERSRYTSNTVGDLDKVNGKIPTQIMQSSSPTGPELVAALDPAEYKTLYRKLIASVGWQQDAIYSISQLVLSCSSRIETRGLNTRRDIWLSFSGPDKIGKKKVAEALAEAIFGSRESLVSVDLSCQGWTSDPSSIFNCAGPKESDKVSRKTIVGHMAEELSKRPHSVVFLENVDEADLLVQDSLFRAIRTGKFRDPHGREISISNMIFVICTTPREKKDECCQNLNVRFPEQRVLEARKWQMRIVVMDRKDASHQLSPNKRKLSTSNSKEDSTMKTRKIYIDLNLPLDESEDSTELESSDSASVSGNSTAWFQDFLMLLHGSVEFKPFNFDALADQIMSKITFLFQRTLGSETNVEVEGDVMVQLLAAAWSSSKKEVLDDWIQQVLGTAFAEARQRCCIAPRSVVRLVACRGVCYLEQAPGVRLPARISIG